ncbi:MAG: chromosomal replication initiator protein DnaA [Chloroflexi bacterium]|nr:chromosomal replication initiator protein DnaA [Chloroflexota bacterium]
MDENMPARRIWETALGQLQLQVTRPNYETWLKETIGLALDHGQFVVGTPSDYHTTWLSTKLHPLISKTVGEIVGRPVQVSFQLDGHNGSSAPPLLGAQPADTAAAVSSPPPRLPLNENYTFERFIAGENSRLAFASALAVAETPAQVYNPLFICGPVGLGKTHLLHAIGHRLAGLGVRLAYLTAEHFTNDFITAIAQHRNDEFRRRYRHSQALLVDDIQFLAGKDRTQEEFFYTFHDLHAGGAQIVVTSDRPPEALCFLEGRLRSRFQGGLVADIQPPDLETRLAILDAKAAERRADLPGDVAGYLAERFRDNVRELEGSLNRVLAYARLAKSPITLDIARQAVSALSPSTGPTPPSPDTIINTVARYFKLQPHALAGKNRTKPIADARHIAMYLLREESQLQLKEIGRLLGNRDHSTVIHAYTKITNLSKSDPPLKLQVTEIRNLLASRYG